MFKKYKNNIINNTVYRPKLYKKGKLWLVSGITMLSLISLGGFKHIDVHAANANLNNQASNQTKTNATQPSNPKTITNQANALHDQILSNNAMYLHSNNNSSNQTTTGLSKLAVTRPTSNVTPKSNTNQNSNSASNVTNNASNSSSASSNKSSSIASNATNNAGNIIKSSSNITSNSGSNITNLSAIQSSFANQVNNKGLGETRIASAGDSKENIVSPYTHSNVTPNSNSASNVTSNSSSNSNSLPNISSKSASVGSISSSNITSNLVSASASNKKVNKGNIGIDKKVMLGDSNYVTETIHFHNISSILPLDDLPDASDTQISGNNNTLENISCPKDWAFVDNNGKYIGNSDTFILHSGVKTFNIVPAPSSDGVSTAYNYNKNNQSLEIVGGAIGFAIGMFQGAGTEGVILKSIKIDSDVNTTNMISGSWMFQHDTHLQSLSLPAGFGKNLEAGWFMFDNCNKLQSLILPAGFGKNITNARDMFSNCNNLQSLNLPAGFGKNITNAREMFSDDTHLQSLNLPAGFGKNITNAKNMFNRTHCLKKITINSSDTKIPDNAEINNKTSIIVPPTISNLNLSNSDKEKISKDIGSDAIGDSDSDAKTIGQVISDYGNNASDFQTLNNDDYKLSPNIINIMEKNKVAIENTPISDIVASWHRLLPSKDSAGHNYTSPITNDFSKGNVGTFVLAANVPLDTVNYQYNGNTIATQQFWGNTQHFNGNNYTNLDINKSNATNIPNGYHLVNTDNNIPFNTGTYNVQITPNVIPTHITYHDIYSDIDGMGNQVPQSTTITGKPNTTQSATLNNSNWALVNAQGQPVKSDQITLNGNKQILNVAPVYQGLTYKYNKASQSLEFTGGTLTWNGTGQNAFIGGNDNISPVPNTTDSSIRSIKFDDNIDTSNVTNMGDMFSGDSALQSLDLGNNFNTSKVTDMSYMFENDYNLQSLDLGNNFDTSNVTNMQGMFTDTGLSSLNLGNNFNTSNVTDMQQIFLGNINLRIINLGNKFDTSNITNMQGMFSGDPSLQSLNLSKFNTSNVTNMQGMFADDPSLQSLNLSKFNTSKVTDMSYMFGRMAVRTSRGFIIDGDDSLNTIIFSKLFNTRNASTSNMFSNDISLNKIIIKSHNTIFNNKSHINNSTVLLPKSLSNLSYKSKQKLINDILSAQSDASDYSNTNTYRQLISDYSSDFSDSAANELKPYLSLNPVRVNQWYKQDANDSNTSPTPNNFTQGNVGTFIRPESIPSDTVSYQYNGNTLSTQQFKGDAQHYSGNGYNDLDVNSSNDNNIPANYHLVNADNDIPFNGGTYNVQITPNIATTTINYIDASDNNQNVGSNTISGNSCSPLPTINANTPSGYRLIKFANNNPSTFNGQPVNIIVSCHGKVNYIDQNGHIIKTIIEKYISNGKPNTINTSDNTIINNTPSGYSLTGDNWASNGYDVDVHLTNQGKVYYINKNGQIIKTITETLQSDGQPDSINTNSNTIRSNVPTGYQQTSLNWISDTTNVYSHITPVIAKDTITYQLSNGTVKGSKTYKGNSSSAQGASDTSFNANDGVPSNYHATSNTDFDFDGQPHTVTIAPTNVTDNIRFNGDLSANTTMTGQQNSQGKVSAPANYHFADNNNQESFTFNGGTHQFNVVPNNENDAVDYSDGTSQISSTHINGNYNTSAKSSIDSNVPNHYHLINGDTGTFTPNGTFHVQVAPDIMSDTIDFNGDSNANTIKKGAYNTQSSVQAPSDYHYINGSNGQFTFNGTTHTFNVAHNTDTDDIIYQATNGNTISSTTSTGNDKESVKSVIDANVPSNYSVINGTDNQNYTNSNNIKVTVAPNKETDTVDYVDNNNHQVKSTQITGNYNSDAKGSIDGNIPNDYHIISGDTGVFTPNSTFTVKVAPNTATNTITYQTSDGNTIHTSDISGSNGAKLPNVDKNIPSGYYLVKNASNNPTTFNGQPVDVIISNKSTINYFNQNGNLISKYDTKLSSNGTNNSFNLPSDNTINSNIPSGYYKTGSNTASNGHDIDTNISNQTTYTYDLNGNPVKTANGTLESDGSNNSYKFNNSDINNKVPTGYHVLNTNQNGNNNTVNIAPNAIKGQVKFINKQNGQEVGVPVSDNGHTGDTFNPSQFMSNVPTNYQYDSTDNNSSQPLNNDGTYTVYVTPIVDHMTINYQYNGNTVAPNTISGNQGTNIPSTDITNHVPNGYHITGNIPTKFNQSGTVNVNLAPNTITGHITINYRTDGNITKTLKSDITINPTSNTYTLPSSVVAKYIKDNYTLPDITSNITNSDVKNGSKNITLNFDTESAGTMVIHYYDENEQRDVSTVSYTKQEVQDLCPYVNRDGGLHWADGENVELAPYADRQFGTPIDNITGEQILYILGCPGKPIPTNTHLIHTVNPITLLHSSGLSNIYHPVAKGLSAYVTFK